MDARHKYIVGRVKDFLTVGDQASNDRFSLRVETDLAGGTTSLAVLDGFLNGTGPNAIIISFEPTGSSDGEVLKVRDAADRARRPQRRCVFCTRAPTGRAINNRDHVQTMNDVSMGVIGEDALQGLEASILDVFVPLLERQPRWGKNTAAERARFLHAMRMYTDQVQTLREAEDDGVELTRVDDSLWRHCQPSSSKRATADPKSIALLEGTVQQWRRVVEGVLASA